VGKVPTPDADKWGSCGVLEGIILCRWRQAHVKTVEENLNRDDVQSKSWKAVRQIWPEVLFVGGLYGVLMVLFALLRGVLLWRNSTLTAQVPFKLLLQSFWVGARFDLAISSYLLIPLLLLLILLPRYRRLLLSGFAVSVGLLLFMGVAEIEFYREFESRFNNLVFEYLGHPKIVAGMIWDGYPVLRYTLLWIVLAAVLAGSIVLFYRIFLRPQRPVASSRQSMLRIMGTVVALTLMIFFSRGGFGSSPLRWGDAFFCEVPFANHLALNGFFTLGRSIWDKIYSKHKGWVKAMPPDKALQMTRGMLSLPGDQPLASNDYPLLRRQQTASGTSPAVTRQNQRAPNVVVILMESFSARFVGTLGAEQKLTPEFDRLADKGVLYKRAFSNGTHTHQGVYASLTSFPNLPGYEYLMKMMEANQEFSGLPSILDRHGYQTLFLYNGLFSWDNKEGFFRQHGIDRFIGTEDYRDPTFVDPVWGVSDYDVYHRANAEFSAMAKQGPFLGVILTLSNHAPFNLPEPLPFPRIETGNDMDARFNGMRYADWSLGEFFRMASKEPYFDNTLFVITGDHGFASPPMITPMQLSRFHVPLLFYAPGLIGENGQKRETVASQVDITPSILGLLGLKDPQQCWGRNLFALDAADEGFAVIKPSGGEDEVALIEGDRVLIKSPKGKPRLYRYVFGPPPNSSENLYGKQKTLARAMEKSLLAYVQTGILTLRARHLGLPPGP
jgi:phosphoglycerol transferase MdoB-like AlkP superfamily enzyme